MLRVTGVSVHYGDVVATDHVDLAVADGEIAAVLGPSGSGKTSLLRAVAGLEPVASGAITWDETDVTGTPPHRRDFGLMFQDHALFDHRDVLGNVTFGLRMRGVRSEAQAARAREILDLVGLAGFEHRRVDELSGGEQQRVALARALAPRPRLLMLDEPLAAVDRERRDELAAELRTIIRASGTATLLVTHDLDEAFTLADSVTILDHGRVVRSGTAREVWRAPGSIRAARFLGVTTELTLPVTDGRVDTPWGPVAAPAGASPMAWIGLRPGDLHYQPASELENPPDATTVIGTVRTTWFRGDHSVSHIDAAIGPLVAVGREQPPIGATVAVTADLEAVVILGA
ncbi:MAG: ABC transporter ATP-binding protein [Acidimicrobiia bacterium]